MCSTSTSLSFEFWNYYLHVSNISNCTLCHQCTFSNGTSKTNTFNWQFCWTNISVSTTFLTDLRRYYLDCHQHLWQKSRIVKPFVKPTFAYDCLPLNISTSAQFTIYGKQFVQMLFLTPAVWTERGRRKQCAFLSFALTKEEFHAKFALHEKTVLKSCRCLILIGESFPSGNSSERF